MSFISELAKRLLSRKGEESDSEDSDTEVKYRAPVQTTYNSADVAIPADFLSCTSPPPDARPVVAKVIDFAQTPLPEYKGLFAVVLDNVMSPSECEAMLRLAEASVPVEDHRIKKQKKKKNAAAAKPRESSSGGEPSSDEPPKKEAETDPWRPALVNVGGGFEAHYPHYRNSDRIIWDQQEVVDRLWARCASAPMGPASSSRTLAETLAVVEGDSPVLGDSVGRPRRGERWELRRFNRRMRFLRYGGGQFFRAHCDGAYREPVDDGRELVTLFTVHLYLNDSKAEAEPGSEGKNVDEKGEMLEGGATSFLSTDETRRVDVDPKAGRVLIFQHRRLNHSGDDVRAGTKYTMRTDIIFEKVDKKAVAAETSQGKASAA